MTFLTAYCARAGVPVSQQAFVSVFGSRTPQQALELASQVGVETFEPSTLASGKLPPEVAQPGVEQRCRLMLERIQEAAGVAGMQVSLHLASGFAPLAAALPGQVWVDAPRVETLSDEALCFLLSHELAHLVHQDHARVAGREQAFQQLTQGMDPFDFEAVERLQPLVEASQKMERAMEHDADRFAGGVSRTLGYDPRAAASEVLALLYHSEASSQLEKTHGTMEERLKAATSC